MTEAFALPATAERAKLDAKRLEHAAHLTLELPEAVRIMASVQLDKTLSDQEVDDIVAFLNSLTGELPENYATVPILPPGGLQ